ncbi:MAG: hypothetical protein ABJA79_11625 [Parafilimonas sp.]
MEFVEIADAKKQRVKTKKAQFLKDLNEAVNEVNMIKAGKKRSKPFQQLLDEL